MKKALAIAVGIVVLGLAGLLFVWYGPGAPRVRATALAPAETVLFVHLPDLRQSALRWPKTSLAQIAQEPEMQAFLERPRQNLPIWAESEVRLDQITSAAPREAFVAITSVPSNGLPRFVAGFSFSGSTSAVESLVTDAREAIREAHPAGRADLSTYAGAEIETYIDGDFVVAETIHNRWYLVASDLELLQRTLDQLDAKPGSASSVSSDELYREALKPLPTDADVIVFGKLESLSDALGSLMAAAGQSTDPKQLEELRKTRAFSGAIKMEGEQIRDMVFLLGPQEAPDGVMPRRALDMSTPETVLYYVVNMPQQIELNQGSLAPLAMFMPGISAVETALQKTGLKFSDFGAIFGPEMSVLVDWPQGEMQPTVTLGFDVRDSVRARDFMDAIAASHEGWSTSTVEDTTKYASPPMGLLPGPSLALSQNFVVMGFSETTVSASLERLKNKKPHLGASDSFLAAVGQVSPPTEAFGYLDTARLFERAYGLFRPFVGMAMAFSPEAGKYIDAGKMPSSEVVTRHLLPSVYSQTGTSAGTLIESAGTLTFNQAIAGVTVAGVAASVGTMQNALKGGTQSLPGLMPPGIQPPPPPAIDNAPAVPASNDPAPPSVPEPMPPGQPSDPERP
jgi:hypothetical protein